MYSCHAEAGLNAVLVTYVNFILLSGGMVIHLLKRYGGLDLGVPDKRIGVALMVTDERTKLDQSSYTESIVIEGMGSFDDHKVSKKFNPGMNL